MNTNLLDKNIITSEPHAVQWGYIEFRRERQMGTHSVQIS